MDEDTWITEIKKDLWELYLHGRIRAAMSSPIWDSQIGNDSTMLVGPTFLPTRPSY